MKFRVGIKIYCVTFFQCFWIKPHSSSLPNVENLTTLVSPSRFALEKKKKKNIMAIATLFALHANAINYTLIFQKIYFLQSIIICNHFIKSLLMVGVKKVFGHLKLRFILYLIRIKHRSKTPVNQFFPFDENRTKLLQWVSVSWSHKKYQITSKEVSRWRPCQRKLNEKQNLMILILKSTIL